MPEEVAEGSLFLQLESSSFMTGFARDINGGAGMYY
jgi:hypothetical protein